MSDDPKGTHFLTEKTAKQAVEFILPSIHNLIEKRVLPRKDFHIVIAMRPTHWYERMKFAEHIVYQYSSTDRSTWEHPYDEYAIGKCLQSWRHGKSTREIQTLSPHLLMKGDVFYYGSVVDDEIVGACSGFEEHQDEMISSWVVASCKMLCTAARENLKEGGGFI